MAPGSSSEDHQPNDTVPLISSYNERILPLMDAVDRLRNLNVMNEGIQLPTIVVIGDQSSGKSSVLESLAGISLPRGVGICTRVPLIMRLQSSAGSNQILQLEYNERVVPTDELHISEAISAATEEIVGKGKGKCISKTPLTLLINKKGVPNLTLIDLPGIVRFPVGNQPKDIYDQVTSIIKEYISPKETIILNVLSASVDLASCGSMTMSRDVDPTGMRTLLVITKPDKDPEELLDKLSSYFVDLTVGLGYVCVRNSIKGETYEEARVAEALLFKNDPHLSKIDKSIVGIPVLAKKLMHIQAAAISKCLPEILKKITDKLNQNVYELNKMPKSLTTILEAVLTFTKVLGKSKETLQCLLVRGEYSAYKKDEEMHCLARLAGMLINFYKELRLKFPESDYGEQFLMDEVMVTMKCNGIGGLPSTFSHTAFSTLLEERVDQIAEIPVNFMEEAWSCVEKVVERVLMENLDMYPQLQSLTRRASQNMMTKVKTQALDRVKEIIKMEKFADYSCDPEYFLTWSRLMSQHEGFLKIMTDSSKSPTKLKLEKFGEVDVRHLKEVDISILQQAFQVKMRLTAYWNVVLVRIVDNLALYLSSRLRDLVTEEMETEILKEIMDDSDGGGGSGSGGGGGSGSGGGGGSGSGGGGGSGSGGGGGLKRMLEEPPSIASKRVKLNKSINLLKESKTVMGDIIASFSN